MTLQIPLPCIRNDRWGYRHPSDGRLIVEPIYSYASSFEEGIGKLSDRIGMLGDESAHFTFVDTSGKTIGVLENATSYSRFSEGLYAS